MDRRPSPLERAVHRGLWRAPWPALRIVAAVVAWIGSGGPARAEPPADVSLHASAASSSGAARAGSIEEDARAAEALAARHAEDPGPRLDAAWAWFRLGRWERAERWYRAALAIAPLSVDARLGLGFSLARQGRCEDALPVFASVDAIDPGSARARDGLAACAGRRAFHATPFASGTAHVYDRHPWKKVAVTSHVGLAIDWRRNWFLGLAHRYTWFDSGSTAVADWGQHEGWIEAGWGRALGGITLKYGVLVDGSRATGVSHHAGVVGRYSGFGDLTIEAAVSVYDGDVPLRAAAALRIPLGAGLSLTPSASAQYTGGQPGGSGGLALSLSRGRFSAWIGGRYGRERRAADLSSSVVWNGPEWNLGGARAGVAVKAGPVHLTLGYEWARLQLDTAGATDADAHFAGLGLRAEF